MDLCHFHGAEKTWRQVKRLPRISVGESAVHCAAAMQKELRRSIQPADITRMNFCSGWHPSRSRILPLPQGRIDPQPEEDVAVFLAQFGFSPNL